MKHRRMTVAATTLAVSLAAAMPSSAASIDAEPVAGKSGVVLVTGRSNAPQSIPDDIARICRSFGWQTTGSSFVLDRGAGGNEHVRYVGYRLCSQTSAAAASVDLVVGEAIPSDDNPALARRGGGLGECQLPPSNDEP